MPISKIPAAGFSDAVNFRNIIINGDMSLAQRATSDSSNTTGGYVTCDRWLADIDTQGTWTLSQSTEVPSGQGFAKSFKYDCTTADASPAAGDKINLQQRLEGQMLQYLKKGTSSAESTTLSFWVRSNKTGTYICELQDVDNTRSISKSYTISAADTWEKKTITFAGDTSGALDNDNARSLDVIWYLGAGSNLTSGTLNTSWNSTTAANRAVGQVNLADSTDNEWYITGVQLEAGTAASEFEFLPHDVNLDRCYRYFQMIVNAVDDKGLGSGWYSASGNARFQPEIKKTMRSTPSLYQTTASDSFRLFSAGGGNDLIDSWAIMSGSSDNFVIANNTANASGTAGQVGYVLTNQSTSYFGLESEL